MINEFIYEISILPIAMLYQKKKKKKKKKTNSH